MNTFNVLDKPWIPVFTSDGLSKDVGIREAIFNSPSIIKIRDDDPLQKIAIIRLLTAFLSDAYHLENKADRKALYQKGSFDQDVIETYILHCVNDCGASFDLFDEKRPFMVQAFDSKLDVKLKSAVNICITIPSGNNPLHFNHTADDEFSGFSPAEALRNILATYLFAPAMSGGYPSSVNNTPPEYFAPVGSNLFEQLVMCMRSTRELGNINLDHFPCSWNSSERIIPGMKIPAVSFLSAMTFQSRRITLIPDDDGLIRKCYFSPGMNFLGNDLWKDPFVAYFKKDDGTFGSVKPQKGRELWRDVGNITSGSKSIPPTVLTPLQNERMINVYSVGLVTNQAAIIQTFQDRISIPQILLENEYLSDQIQSDVDLIEKIYRLINGEKGTNTKKPGIFAEIHEIVPDLQSIFLSEAHNMLVNQYFSEVAHADLESEDWIEKLNATLNDHIRTIIKDICRSAEHFTSNWEEIKETEVAIRKLQAAVKTILSKTESGEENS